MAHPADGIYKQDGLGYISVGDVLGKTLPLFDPGRANSLEWWRNNYPGAIEILERGQARGTFIHGEMEIALTGESVIHAAQRPTYEDMISYNLHEYMTYLDPLIKEIKKENPCSSLCHPSEFRCSVGSVGDCHTRKFQLLIEKEIYCPYGWGGTPDLRLMFEGLYTLMDYKSVRSYKEEGVKKEPKPISKYKEAIIQVGGYALGHNIIAKKVPWMKPIEQGAICICYDWREPHVHLINKKELKEAASIFLQRFKVYQTLTNSQFPIKL
jgi:hypothetical protein